MWLAQKTPRIHCFRVFRPLSTFFPNLTLADSGRRPREEGSSFSRQNHNPYYVFVSFLQESFLRLFHHKINWCGKMDNTEVNPSSKTNKHLKAGVRDLEKCLATGPRRMTCSLSSTWLHPLTAFFTGTSGTALGLRALRAVYRSCSSLNFLHPVNVWHIVKISN